MQPESAILRLFYAICARNGQDEQIYVPIAACRTRPVKKYRVKPGETDLNLRKTPMIPKAKPTSKILIQIPGGQALTFLAKSANPAWLKVDVIINSVPYLGYVAAEYVEVS